MVREDDAELCWGCGVYYNKWEHEQCPSCEGDKEDCDE